MRLGGWQRIGIVLSIVWAIGAAIYQRNVDVKNANGAASLAYQVCGESEAFRRGERDCTREMDKTWDLMLQGSWGNVAIFSLAPIPIGWIMVYSLIGVSRWVIRGFRKDMKEKR